MFKSILLATDGSKHARKAATVAADLAATYGARLTLVSVAALSLSADEVERMPQAKRFPKSVRDEMRKLRDVLSRTTAADDVLYPNIPAPVSALAALSNEILNETESIAKRKKVKTVVRVPLTGNAADRILEQVSKTKADLIVMGTRGLSDLGGLVMGSVSHKVIHLAKCACLTVK